MLPRYDARLAVPSEVETRIADSRDLYVRAFSDSILVASWPGLARSQAVYNRPGMGSGGAGLKQADNPCDMPYLEPKIPQFAEK